MHTKWKTYEAELADQMLHAYRTYPALVAALEELVAEYVNDDDARKTGGIVLAIQALALARKEQP